MPSCKCLSGKRGTSDEHIGFDQAWEAWMSFSSISTAKFHSDYGKEISDMAFLADLSECGLLKSLQISLANPLVLIDSIRFSQTWKGLNQKEPSAEEETEETVTRFGLDSWLLILEALCGFFQARNYLTQSNLKQVSNFFIKLMNAVTRSEGYSTMRNDILKGVDSRRHVTVFSKPSVDTLSKGNSRGSGSILELSKDPSSKSSFSPDKSWRLLMRRCASSSHVRMHALAAYASVLLVKVAAFWGDYRTERLPQLAEITQRNNFSLMSILPRKFVSEKDQKFSELRASSTTAALAKDPILKVKFMLSRYCCFDPDFTQTGVTLPGAFKKKKRMVVLKRGQTMMENAVRGSRLEKKSTLYAISLLLAAGLRSSMDSSLVLCKLWQSLVRSAFLSRESRIEFDGTSAMSDETANRDVETVAGTLFSATAWSLSPPNCGMRQTLLVDIPMIGKLGMNFTEFFPEMFNWIRHSTNISEDDFKTSLCSSAEPFIEFTSNSQSGNFFFFSGDGKYLLKTVSHTEAGRLIKFLPSYVRHLQHRPASFLCRMYGLFNIKIQGQRRASFVPPDPALEKPPGLETAEARLSSCIHLPPEPTTVPKKSGSSLDQSQKGERRAHFISAAKSTFDYQSSLSAHDTLTEAYGKASQSLFKVIPEDCGRSLTTWSSSEHANRKSGSMDSSDSSSSGFDDSTSASSSTEELNPIFESRQIEGPQPPSVDCIQELTKRNMDIYFVVLGTIFDPHVGVDEMFDLKGSTVSRTAKSEDTVKKDNDWIHANKRLHLTPMMKDLFLDSHKADCEFLRAQGIFDYSLLIGIRYIRPHEDQLAKTSRGWKNSRTDIIDKKVTGIGGTQRSLRTPKPDVCSSTDSRTERFLVQESDVSAIFQPRKRKRRSHVGADNSEPIRTQRKVQEQKDSLKSRSSAGGTTQRLRFRNDPCDFQSAPCSSESLPRIRMVRLIPRDNSELTFNSRRMDEVTPPSSSGAKADSSIKIGRSDRSSSESAGQNKFRDSQSFSWSLIQDVACHVDATFDPIWFSLKEQKRSAHCLYRNFCSACTASTASMGPRETFTSPRRIQVGLPLNGPYIPRHCCRSSASTDVPDSPDPFVDRSCYSHVRVKSARPAAVRSQTTPNIKRSKPITPSKTKSKSEPNIVPSLGQSFQLSSTPEIPLEIRQDTRAEISFSDHEPSSPIAPQRVKIPIVKASSEGLNRREVSSMCKRSWSIPIGMREFNFLSLSSSTDSESVLSNQDRLGSACLRDYSGIRNNESLEEEDINTHRSTVRFEDEPGGSKVNGTEQDVALDPNKQPSSTIPTPRSARRHFTRFAPSTTQLKIGSISARHHDRGSKFSTSRMMSVMAGDDATRSSARSGGTSDRSRRISFDSSPGSTHVPRLMFNASRPSSMRKGAMLSPAGSGLSELAELPCSIYSVPSANLNEIYFVALIDFITPYGLRRYFHTLWKYAKSGGPLAGAISPVPPKFYSRRQAKFVEEQVVLTCTGDNNAAVANAVKRKATGLGKPPSNFVSDYSSDLSDGSSS